ncbi:biotin transport system ATP-binding protein [Naumannella cuiyingiana]|uniref:Biotin transport system ATP-binding protein n=1 Tax=Naumannella cuiyingiana TaxID=1347891 RepID=A0A7Z0DBH8_9ACTN|nr:ABC transporter ATP-binding protein [Naumannella cuiyingiana]NYI72428.1 biotin transport system ATP-binding protein [Naumannella cuiyingiana]
MISFENVSVRHGDRLALAGIDLALPERRIGILGANGSGKSTLVRCLNALTVPDTGRVRVAGIDVARHPARARRLVGFLFPDADAQIIMPTVREDLAFSLRGLPRAEVDRRVDAALDRWGLAGHADHPCHLLSGGQKQVLALAAVLLVEPAVLVADEPTTLLDLRNTRRLGAALAELDQQQVVVTHHPELLADFDRVLVLDAGRVACDDAPAAAIAFHDRLMR